MKAFRGSGFREGRYEGGSISGASFCICGRGLLRCETCPRPSERGRCKGRKKVKHGGRLGGASATYTKSCPRPPERGRCKGRKNLKQGRRLGGGLKRRSGEAVLRRVGTKGVA